MQLENKVVVIGGDHHNTLGVIRSLGEAGVNPYVFIIKKKSFSYVLKSKYIKKGYKVKETTDVFEMLNRNFNDEQKPPIIISCSDKVASELDLKMEEMKIKYKIPCSNKGQGFLTNLMNKEKMIQLAEAVGMQAPKTYSKIEDVEFPCFVKPLVSKNGSKSQISKIENLESLKTYLQEINASSILIQEYVEKDFEYQIIGCSLNGGEQVIIPGVSKIIRCSDRSNTGFLQYLPEKDFDFSYKNQCCKFLKCSGYSGLFSIEFMRGKDGKDYFLEINFRNDGNAICVNAAGVNLPYIWCKYNAGHDISDLKMSVEKQVLVMPEFNDFLLVLKKKIKFKDWNKDRKRTNCFMEYDKKDKKPFYYRFFQALGF